MALTPGQRLGPYEVVSALGAGGMGLVYLARDTRLRRQVALKLLPVSVAGDADRLRRFELEAQAISALNHPNILTLYEVGQVDDIHFIATEYVEGRTLRQVMTQERLDVPGVLEIATQIGAALVAAHAAGVVHRDLKPENVVVRPDGLVKVLDFGLAKLTENSISNRQPEDLTALDNRTQPGCVMGTPRYMSPEQTRGRDVDTRSDLFSLGVVLYELLCAQPPFDGETGSDLVAAILKTEPLPLTHYLPDVPWQLEHVLQKLLRKDREARYQSAKDLVIDLKDLKSSLELRHTRDRDASPSRARPGTETSQTIVVPDAVVPETKYARSGNLHIAYQVAGSGPVDLVFIHGWVSHIELLWEEPSVARFLRRLSAFSRLILLDKRGTGLSDPVPLDQLPTLEERMDDVRAVMDAAGSKRAALLGTSEAGALNLLFAATHPERVSALILLNSYARLAWSEDYPYGIRPGDAEGLLKAIADGWGKGVAFEALVASQSDNQSMRHWWARYQRLAASPGTAVTLLRRAFDTDARAVLPSIGVRTLILHKAGDPFTGAEHGRFLAEQIAGARFVELSGHDHLFFAEDTDSIIAEIQELLKDVREENEPDRILATVLFAEIVGASDGDTRPTDQRLHEVLAQYDGMVRDELARFRGRRINRAGEGVFAAFDGPARAIGCAQAIASGALKFGLAVRSGVHTGECDVVGSDLGGVGVQMGAAVASRARPGEVLVSSTVKDLVSGSRVRFEDRGVQLFEDLPGKWRLFAVGGESDSERTSRP